MKPSLSARDVIEEERRLSQSVLVGIGYLQCAVFDVFSKLCWSPNSWCICWSKQDSVCRGLPRDPAQISQEPVVLALLRSESLARLAGTTGIWREIETESTHEVEKNIKTAVYSTKAKQGKTSGNNSQISLK